MPELTKREREILTFIKRRKMTSPIVIQAYFNMPRLSVQEILNMLWRLNLVSRPVRGLIMDKEWITKNDDKRKEIEATFECTIPV